MTGLFLLDDRGVLQAGKSKVPMNFNCFRQARTNPYFRDASKTQR
ncbi:hypothetical protein Poly59_20720 [Rubripirellula reticaptiva]|uniref:Uncharacterized protein n=1 Tax=Rubripirellula reticaptiva TaxID=2528013 RepID=A0A5C6F8B9_9BACT|nr:hypothetical protein Poly59_20720 [Rubripirellula reticaptiva]